MSPTVSSSIRAGVAVTVTCRRCHNHRALDLHDLAARGLAGHDLDALPLVCRCGCREYRVTVSDAAAAGIRPGR